MKKIGILFPSETELAPFLDDVAIGREDIRCGLKIRYGAMGHLELVLSVCGIAKVNAAMAAQSLIDSEQPDLVLVCGVSGGIRKGLLIGDTVLSTVVAHHDVIPSIIAEDNGYEDHWFAADEDVKEAFEKGIGKLSEEIGNIVFGRIVTGEQFIDQEGRPQIIENFDPDCVDMETAAVAQVCKANDLPFFAVRTITDTEDDSGFGTFRENLKVASQRACRILLAGLQELDVLAEE